MVAVSFSCLNLQLIAQTEPFSGFHPKQPSLPTKTHGHSRDIFATDGLGSFISNIKLLIHVGIDFQYISMETPNGHLSGSFSALVSAEVTRLF